MSASWRIERVERLISWTLYCKQVRIHMSLKTHDWSLDSGRACFVCQLEISTADGEILSIGPVNVSCGTKKKHYVRLPVTPTPVGRVQQLVALTSCCMK